MILRWCDRTGTFRPDADSADAVLVVDSFLLTDGRIRGWPDHWRRFTDSCEAVGDTVASDLPARLAEALPEHGRWFPRLELVRCGAARRVRLHIRSSPPRRPEIVVHALTPREERLAPRRKGPDLELLAALRVEAQARGADEALLLDERGRAIEGATTSLLWWEGEILCAVPESAPMLAGVTRALLLRLARAESRPIKLVVPRLQELEGREVWLVNALQGISRVVGWTAGTVGADEENRAEIWQRRLEDLAEPIASVERPSSPIVASVVHASS